MRTAQVETPTLHDGSDSVRRGCLPSGHALPWRNTGERLGTRCRVPPGHMQQARTAPAVPVRQSRAGMIAVSTRRARRNALLYPYCCRARLQAGDHGAAAHVSWCHSAAATWGATPQWRRSFGQRPMRRTTARRINHDPCRHRPRCVQQRSRWGRCDQRLTGLPSTSSTCTSPSLSARTGASIFFRSPTITQVIASGLMMSLMAFCAAGWSIASRRGLSVCT